MSRIERDVETPVGPARVHVWDPAASPRRGWLVLGHGAGGRSWSSDLLELTALADHGWAVALVEQPWRVKGGRVASRPAQLDLAWTSVLASMPVGPTGTALVVGGRSAGARVACRTAATVGASAVVALAFPLQPPRRGSAVGVTSRAAEAQRVVAAGLPLLVVQGERDPFGSPAQVRAALGAAALVVGVPGTHSFGVRPVGVMEAVRSFLESVLERPAGSLGS